jgi:hypothetical protein
VQPRIIPVRLGTASNFEFTALNVISTGTSRPQNPERQNFTSRLDPATSTSCRSPDVHAPTPCHVSRRCLSNASQACPVPELRQCFSHGVPIEAASRHVRAAPARPRGGTTFPRLQPRQRRMELQLRVGVRVESDRNLYRRVSTRRALRRTPECAGGSARHVAVHGMGTEDSHSARGRNLSFPPSCGRRKWHVSACGTGVRR